MYISKRKKLTAVAACIALYALTSPINAESQSQEIESKPNVLFIAVDDLRVQHGKYDLDQAHTPNLDKLAEQGVTFTRAYSNVPVCGASRASMLTGVRPTMQRFMAFESADEIAAWATPMPQVFKNNGYTTISLGKVFNNQFDHVGAWSEEPWRPKGATNEYQVENDSRQALLLERHDYLTEENLEMALKGSHNHPAYEIADVSDDAYKNGKIAAKAIEDLQRLSSSGKPFFLAVGLKKPHLPFNAPRKYWEMYNEEDINLSATPNMPTGAPKHAHHTWGELRNYGHDGLMPQKGGKELMPDDLAKKLIHGYRAATSYSDALIGNILSELERLGLDNNTIVVLWGDHGWSLGEHTQWAKHSSFNVTNHIPLIIRAPGFNAGTFVNGLVESIDIFPTLTELTGIKAPNTLHGTSLLPMLKDPKISVNSEVFFRWKNADSIRTDQYLYTVWRDKAGEKVIGSMLFDHHVDMHETVNLSQNPQYKSVVENLHEQLMNHIKHVEN